MVMQQRLQSYQAAQQAQAGGVDYQAAQSYQAAAAQVAGGMGNMPMHGGIEHPGAAVQVESG
jgi:hypothetical protein